MRIKIQKNNEDEVIVSYFQLKEIDDFRYGLLKKVIDETGEELIVMIDTNQKKRSLEFDGISEYLSKNAVQHAVREIPANEKKIFGFTFGFLGNKKKEPERMFVLALTPEKFTREMYDALFKYYDLAIGFSGRKDFQHITDRCVSGLHEVLFNDEYFNHSIYDSGLFETIRSTIDISGMAKDVYQAL